MDRRDIIKRLFPEHLYNNEEYRVLIDTFAEELGLVSDYIEIFSNLSKIDRTPKEFIQDLANLISISYSDNYDEDTQREAFKRIVSVYKNRGSEDDIKKSADYGGIPSWLGDDIFLDKSEVLPRRANLEWAYKRLFRHDISKHSGGDKFPDNNRWRDGVVIIKVDFVDDRVVEAIRKVIPAGIKFFFEIVLLCYGDGELGEITVGDINVGSDYVIYINITSLQIDITRTFSGKRPPIFSGEQVLFSYFNLDIFELTNAIPEYSENMTKDTLLSNYNVTETIEELYKEPLMIILKESFNSSDIVVKITKCGRAIRNEFSSLRDGERPYSGSYTGEFSGYSNVNTILPTDFNYTLSQVLDKKVGDAYGDLEFEVEVKQNLITEV